jgi:hypothetical protein
MKKRLICGLLLFCCTTLSPAQEPARPIDWEVTSLDSVGGHKTTIVGSPRLIDTPSGKAVEFDGQSGLFLDINPLAGLKQFTAEVVFQPSTAGPKEQRFLHFQENGTENRLLFEIRLTDDNRWFLDTFIKSGDGNYTLYAEKFPHAIGPWYHATVVMDGTTMRHYINGIEEMATPIKFTPQKEGRTSIGVRINRVSWFKGAVRRVRITPRALTPNEFLPH